MTIPRHLTRRRWLVSLASLGLGAGPASRAQDRPASPELPPVAAYASLPDGEGARLSPDGHRLALIQPVQGRYAIVVRDLSGARPPVVYKTGDGHPQWLRWKSDQRLIASLSVVTQRGPRRQTQDTRLIALAPEGDLATELVRADPADLVPQVQDRVVSLLPGDPDHLLLELPHFERSTRLPISAATLAERLRHPEVVTVDLRTGQTRIRVPQHGQINRWLATPDGQVLAGWSLQADRQVELLVRDHEAAPWRVAHRLPLNQGLRFTPVAFAVGRTDTLLVLSNHEGGPAALHEFMLTTSSWGRRLSEPGQGDVGVIVEQGRLVGYEGGAVSGPRYLDPDWAADAATITRALPGARVQLVDRSRDGLRVLAQVARGNEPADFWLLTRRAGQPPELAPVTDRHPDVDPATVSPSQWVAYTARDGLRIPALLTLPRSHRSGDLPRPFIVMPHDGPAARDTEGFHPWVQLLASRGWGVLQPQYRGSSGQGAAFLAAGQGQWGRAMQDDLTDGTRWLVQQKWADPRRIALVGRGYGGYAVLVGLARDPALYAAGVAIAPVADLVEYADDQRLYAFGELDAPRLGQDFSALDAVSPVRLAGQITAPLLLIHGRRDVVVPLRHTERMTEALSQRGRPPRTLVLDDAGHDDRHAASHLALLQVLERFLAEHLNANPSVPR